MKGQKSQSQVTRNEIHMLIYSSFLSLHFFDCEEEMNVRHEQEGKEKKKNVLQVV